MATTDPRLSRLLSESHMLLTMFAKIVRAHTGQHSPMIERLRSEIEEYLGEVED